MLAALSVALPPLAVVAVVALVFALLFSSGRARLIVGVVGFPLAMAGLYRFTVGTMMPNLVSAGQRAAEERAVSRLREILWAERRVKELGYVDADRDGTGEFALLPELVGTARRPGTNASAAVLKPELYRLVRAIPAVFQSEGYLFAVYLPGAPPCQEGASAIDDPVDAAGAAQRFVAYAWPLVLDQNGRRVFAIDQDDHVCETENPRGYAGFEVPVSGAAGPLAAAFASCGRGGDGDTWRRWRKLGR